MPAGPCLCPVCRSVVALCCALAGRQLLGRKGPLQGQGVKLEAQQQRHRQLHTQRSTLFSRAGAPLASPFTGAAYIGGALMAVFFTVIGASAGSMSAFAQPETPALLAFIFVMVSLPVSNLACKPADGPVQAAGPASCVSVFLVYTCGPPV